jgi:hypothetical protein
MLLQPHDVMSIFFIAGVREGSLDCCYCWHNDMLLGRWKVADATRSILLFIAQSAIGML